MNKEIIDLKNNNELTNKEKIKNILINCDNFDLISENIIELFNLHQCDKKSCYWYYNKKLIFENNCCLSKESFYNCYNSNFEYYQDGLMSGELGMNEVKEKENE